MRRAVHPDARRASAVQYFTVSSWETDALARVQSHEQTIAETDMACGRHKTEVVR